MSGREEREPDDRDDREDPEALPEAERIADAEWQAFVAELRGQTAAVPEVSPEEIRDVLDDEDWSPPEPEPVGWRTASPTLVLGLVGALGGLLALLLGAVFLRPLPGWALLVLLTVTLASAAVLFTRLPGSRNPEADGGEV
jgi:ABC-type branched-subunit amino acid transport system permease subunit